MVLRPPLLLAKVDKVALLGTSLGLASFFFLKFVNYRPHRLSSGTGHFFWETVPLMGTLIFFGLWLIMLILAFYKGQRRDLNILNGLIASINFFLSFWFAGNFAFDIASQEGVISRISLGAGAWSMAISAYIVLFASLKSFGNSKRWKFLISISGPILLLVLLYGGYFNELSIIKEFLTRKERFIQEFLQHIYLAGLAVGIAILLGVPLGILSFQKKIADKIIFFVANTAQTIPSLALFGLLMAPLTMLSESFPGLRQLGIKGIGWTPALIALTLYSLLPIIRNVATGLHIIDPAIIEAGTGMGMSRKQLLIKVELPLALPIILSGIRTATLQSIGNTTVAALIGAGGLGTFVFQGLGQAAPDLILLGAIPVIILALIADQIMQGIIILLTPRET
jgi:osmoprotectant transport system permease protein